jgi:plastocyanin
MDRRTLLQSLAAGVAVAVAGCGGDSGTPSEESPPASAPDTPAIETPGDTPTPTPEPTPSATPEATSTPESTATPTPESTATPTPESTATPTPESTATPTPESTATPTPEPTATPEPTPTPTPVYQVVEVGAGDGFAFAPESVTIAVGDTVEWRWVGSNHNVTADSVPAGSDWTGTPGAPDRLFDTGYTYQHTFEAAGEYSYYCNPHQSVGMVGSVTVTE